MAIAIRQKVHYSSLSKVKTFAELQPYDGFAGAIAIDYLGNMFHQDSHPSMVFASFDGKTLEVFE